MFLGTVILGIVIFVLLVFGGVYLATEAEILSPLRVKLVYRFEFMAGMLACDECAAFWVGALIAVLAWVAILVVTSVVHNTWIFWVGIPPSIILVGVCGIGVVHLVHSVRGNNDDEG